MYTRLADEKLKSGESLEVGVVLCPDEAHAEQIKPFLRHKPPSFDWHIARSVSEVLDGLETRYYVGKLDGNVICNIMAVESHRTGILGHVFTAPEQRRKGACDVVMKCQMEDFRSRGGGLLLLGTGFESPAYWIYHRYGFRSLTPGSGHMRYATEEDFEKTHFGPAKSRVAEVDWSHWPRLNTLCSVPGPEVVRAVAWGITGRGNFEGGFLNFKRALETAGRGQARLLETERGAVVGFASVAADSRWRGTHILDCFAHADHSDGLSALLEAVPFPAGKIQAYADTGSIAKIKALASTGFQEEARMERQFTWGEGRPDVIVFRRFV